MKRFAHIPDYRFVLFIFLVFQIALSQAQSQDSQTNRTLSGDVPGAKSGKAISRSTTDPQTRLERAREKFLAGRKWYQKSNFSRALADFQEANRLVPSAELAYNIGQIYEQLGDWEQAIAYFKLYLSRSGDEATDSAEVEAKIVNLGKAERRHLGQLLEAPAELSNRLLARFERARADFESGHYKDALTNFAAIQRVYPANELIYNMAVAAERSGRLGDAIDYYTTYLELDSDLSDKSALAAKIGSLRQALEHEQVSDEKP
jgi:tetratricopeptide (TPR) repeat protein